MKPHFFVALTLTVTASLCPEATPQLSENADAETPSQHDARLPVDRVTAAIQALNLRERVAQLMMVSLEGLYSPNAADRQFLEEYKPGGIVIRKLAEAGDAARYTSSLASARLGADIPVLIGTGVPTITIVSDHKKGGFMQLPSLLSLAAANDVDSVGFVACTAAEYLAKMGFNLQLGPVLSLAPDLPDARGSLDIVGSSPVFAGELAAAFVRVLKDYPVVPMPMGFPGGGGNRVGSAPPVLLTSKPALDEKDLLPFRKAVEEGAGIIHVGNTLVPTLDRPDCPASLSAAVIKGLLRERLGFDGVVVAGPIDASHIGKRRDFAEAAVIALDAGADMLLWNTAGRRVMRAVDFVVKAVKDGVLPEKTINSALMRVLQFRSSTNLTPDKRPQRKQIEKLTRSRSLAEEVYLIERRAITMVQNRDHTLPLNRDASMPLGVTGTAGVETLHGALEKHVKPVSMQTIDTAHRVGRIMRFEIERITSHIGGIRTVVCIFTDSGEAAGQANLVHALKGKGVRVVVVLLGYPRNLPELTEADAIVLAYCGSANYMHTLDAVADTLMGLGAVDILEQMHETRASVGQAEVFDVLDVVRCPAGRLPVSIKPPYTAGLAHSYAPTFTIKRVEWDFGDGNQNKGLRTEHAFTEKGRYPVKVTVTDHAGDVVSGTFHIVVE